MSDKKETDKIVDLIVTTALLESFESVMNESKKKLKKEKRKIDLIDSLAILTVACLFLLLACTVYRINII